MLIKLIELVPKPSLKPWTLNLSPQALNRPLGFKPQFRLLSWYSPAPSTIGPGLGGSHSYGTGFRVRGIGLRVRGITFVVQGFRASVFVYREVIAYLASAGKAQLPCCRFPSHESHGPVRKSKTVLLTPCTKSKPEARIYNKPLLSSQLLHPKPYM